MSQKLGLKARRALLGDVTKAAIRDTDVSESEAINGLRSYIVRLHATVRQHSQTITNIANRAEQLEKDKDRLTAQRDRAQRGCKDRLWLGGALGLVAGTLFGSITMLVLTHSV